MKYGNKTKGGFRGFMNAPMNMKKQDNMNQITRKGSAFPMVGQDALTDPNAVAPNRAGGALNKNLVPPPESKIVPQVQSAQQADAQTRMSNLASSVGVPNTPQPPQVNTNVSMNPMAPQPQSPYEDTATNTVGDGVGTTFGGAPAKKGDDKKKTKLYAGKVTSGNPTERRDNAKILEGKKGSEQPSNIGYISMLPEIEISSGTNMYGGEDDDVGMSGAAAGLLLPGKGKKKKTSNNAGIGGGVVGFVLPGKGKGSNMTGPAKKGMGFKAASKSIQKKSGVSKNQANAILAASSRKASAGAKKKNPNLKKVK